MKFAICGSMVFTEEMYRAKTALEGWGHSAVVSSFAPHYVGLSETDKEQLALVHKFENDAIREYWAQIQNADAILVLNYTRRGIPNYIGGNTLMEIGFAHVLHKKIYLLNPVPEIDFYKSEIEAVQPIVLNGDLSSLSAV